MLFHLVAAANSDSTCTSSLFPFSFAAPTRRADRLPSLEFLPQIPPGWKPLSGWLSKGEVGDSCFRQWHQRSAAVWQLGGACAVAGRSGAAAPEPPTPKASSAPTTQVPDPPRPSCGCSGRSPSRRCWSVPACSPPPTRPTASRAFSVDVGGSISSGKLLYFLVLRGRRNCLPSPSRSPDVSFDVIACGMALSLLLQSVQNIH